MRFNSNSHGDEWWEFLAELLVSEEFKENRGHYQIEMELEVQGELSFNLQDYPEYGVHPSALTFKRRGHAIFLWDLFSKGNAPVEPNPVVVYMVEGQL